MFSNEISTNQANLEEEGKWSRDNNVLIII